MEGGTPMTEQELRESNRRLNQDLAQCRKTRDKLTDEVERLQEELKELQERHERRLLKYDITERMRIETLHENERLRDTLSQMVYDYEQGEWGSEDVYRHAKDALKR
jgi:predicted nuclease with TOPRIM domain